MAGKSLVRGGLCQFAGGSCKVPASWRCSIGKEHRYMCDEHKRYIERLDQQSDPRPEPHVEFKRVTSAA